MLAGALTGGVAPAQPELANGIKAVVSDSVITYYEVRALNEQTRGELLRRYSGQPQVLEKKLDEAGRENLEELLKRQLVLQEFKNIKVPEAAVTHAVDREIEDEIHARYTDRRTLVKTLQESGKTLESYRQQLRDRLIIDWLRQQNISSGIIISPHRIEACYQEHKDEFKVEDEVKLRVIILKASEDSAAPSPVKLGEEILAKLREGAPFAEMASIYSQGSERSRGGDWGWYERTRLAKGLADIAASLPTGTNSGVFGRSAGEDYWVFLYENGEPALGRHYGVEAASRKEALLEERRFENADAVTNLPSPREFYLMQVEDRHPARFKPLADVRDQVERTLVLEERKRLEQQWIDRLRKKTFVRYF